MASYHDALAGEMIWEAVSRRRSIDRSTICTAAMNESLFATSPPPDARNYENTIRRTLISTDTLLQRISSFLTLHRVTESSTNNFFGRENGTHCMTSHCTSVDYHDRCLHLICFFNPSNMRKLFIVLCTIIENFMRKILIPSFFSEDI